MGRDAIGSVSVRDAALGPLPSVEDDRFEDDAGGTVEDDDQKTLFEGLCRS